jgi:hypothetical protein
MNIDVRRMKNSNNQRMVTIQKLLLRLELWFAPLLLLIPIIVSVVFLLEWYTKGYLNGSSEYDGEFLLALLLLGGNLIFDIPFVRSIRTLKRKH